MVKENRMDDDFAINYLINALPSAKYLTTFSVVILFERENVSLRSSCSAILTTLCDLIPMSKSEVDKSLFKLNPFVLIYHRKPDCLSSILNLIEKNL